jgi:hypothetical protein
VHLVGSKRGRLEHAIKSAIRSIHFILFTLAMLIITTVITGTLPRAIIVSIIIGLLRFLVSHLMTMYCTYMYTSIALTLRFSTYDYSHRSSVSNDTLQSTNLVPAVTLLTCSREVSSSRLGWNAGCPDYTASCFLLIPARQKLGTYLALRYDGIVLHRFHLTVPFFH